MAAKDSPSRLARAVFILLGLLLLGAAWAWPRFPKRGEARIDTGQSLVGVRVGPSYAWVLKTPRGAALVDTGNDVAGKALLKELAAQGVGPGEVHTVLVTHAHVDHWAAAHLFPNAQVLVGPGEAAVVHRKQPLTSLMSRLHGSSAWPQLPAKLGEVKDGEELDVDGEKIRVIHVPGHTPGSAMFLWRDVLFTGDSLVRSNSGLAAPPFFMSEDREQNLDSLRKLRDVPFTRVADGHSGLTVNAQEQVRKLLE